MSEELSYAIANAINSGTDWLSNDAVKQLVSSKILECEAWIIASVVIVAVCAAYIVITNKLIKNKGEYYLSDYREFALMLSYVVLFIFIVMFVISVYSYIQWTTYPSGCILDMITGKI